MNKLTKFLFNIFLSLLLITGIIGAGILCYIFIGCVIEIVSKGGLP